MDAPSPSAPGERCVEHNLAVGPTGACVLCQRARSSEAVPARWLTPVLLAAALGTALLCGVALGRRGQPAPVLEPPAGATPVETTPAVEAPIENGPVALAEPAAPEARAAPAPPPSPSTPQRDYLDEAYRAMQKSNLHDDGKPAAAQPSAVASTPPVPRPRMGMGGHARGGRH